MTDKYSAAYEPIAIRAPTEPEKKVDIVFLKFIDDEIKLESDEEMFRRDTVLSEVRNIFLNFIQFVATAVLHIPRDEAEEYGGQLFISGSHRLGVRDIGADIDTVCVAPNFVTREHFFTYLKDDLLKRSEVTDMNAVEEAFVPLISFDFRGVSIDLLFARLQSNNVPKDLDILDDNMLIGLDEATEKSLNGPRVTNMIFKLVGEKTFPNFLIVLRCIRKWAKRRGIYGNKLGYLGGVNCNILVAFICQLYPNFTPSALLFRFFYTYNRWKWPEPVMLNNIQHNPFGNSATLSEERPIWSPERNPNDLMPIITPAYPAMNSSFNVSTHTLKVMQQEIERGYNICESILKKNSWQDMKNWKKLFDISDFFLKYNHYLACHIVGTGENTESRSWIGFVESRIRRFTQHPFLSTLPLLLPIHLYPVVSKTAKSAYSICYFIGFSIDYDLLQRIGDNNIHIDECVSRFQ
jgi:poly(A) polymerase